MTERTIKKLSEMDGKVFVYIANAETGKAFVEQARAEGYECGDQAAEVMAVNKDMTITYVGSVGSMAFHSGAKKIGDDELVRIDFGKYIAGADDYIM